jgi:hypothetical protein
MVCLLGVNASEATALPAPLAAPLPPSLPLAARDPEAVLNVVHVPKAGGSSLERCLQEWCAKNRVRCFHTFHRARVPGTWLGTPTTARNGLDRLRALAPAARGAIRLVYGHQESGIDALFARPVQSVAVVRQPEERWLSDVAYLSRHTRLGVLPPECLPRDEIASYLCFGSDHRKGEIVPPGEARDEAYYARRRAPDAATLLGCLRRYVLLLALEADSHFGAVGRLLQRHFPNATVAFRCDARRNVSPHAQKARLRANRSRALGHALRRMNALDQALWSTVRARGAPTDHR